MPGAFDEKERRQIEERLIILEDFLLDVIDHPEKLDEIPDAATLRLIPTEKTAR